ncbi:hypothetical protein H6P81_003096 [Aristolochia fimbriata]|uniref:Putative plant transposon protein domain-containing protein n=1 Tax=Aristolochia fimbriata TaxID=158543 RepID=A0AAV7FBU1_ARIFI|nr:hypothetical protein H6P81_003096 [Aristolochia fimbriata]
MSMRPGKRKITYNKNKFPNHLAQDRYNERFGNLGVIEETGFAPKSPVNELYGEFLKDIKWEKWIFSTPEYAIELVREFYSNLMHEEAGFKVFVRGKWVSYASSKINECLELPKVSDKELWGLQQKIFEAKLVPNNHNTTINKEQSEVIYAFLNGLPINVVKIVTATIRGTKNKQLRSFPYPALITQLCLTQGVELAISDKLEKSSKPFTDLSISRIMKGKKKSTQAAEVTSGGGTAHEAQTEAEQLIGFAEGFAKHLGIPPQLIPKYPEEEERATIEEDRVEERQETVQAEEESSEEEEGESGEKEDQEENNESGEDEESREEESSGEEEDQNGQNVQKLVSMLIHESEKSKPKKKDEPKSEILQSKKARKVVELTVTKVMER